MQVFDLTLLDTLTEFTVVELTAVYDVIGPAHNIVINEQSGTAFMVGSRDYYTNLSCSGGLHMIDITTPSSPSFLGCYSESGYTHDAQCVTYNIGPDTDYTGREICFASNENELVIVDVTDKSNPTLISTYEHPSSYTHQGWLTPDFQYFLIDDELDETFNLVGAPRTSTYVADVSDLDNPKDAGTYLSDNAAIDHNQYVGKSIPLYVSFVFLLLFFIHECFFYYLVS